MTDIFDRLYDRTAVQPNGCWEWTGSRFHDKDYGQIKYRGKNWLTHRLSYLLEHGEIPEGMFVLHSCDNPCCINPEHLFLGTQQDNKDDCVAKDRHAYGTKSGMARLVPEQVLEIRKMLEDNITWREIAAKYDIGQTTVYNIKIGRTWSHI